MLENLYKKAMEEAKDPTWLNPSPPAPPAKLRTEEASTETAYSAFIIMPPNDNQHSEEMEAYPEDYKRSKE